LYYYELSLLNSPLGVLTYASFQTIPLYKKVSVKLRNKILDAVVVKKTTKPEFKTSEILELSEFYFSKEQATLAKFISSYYMCSLGEAFGLMLPFCTSSTQNLQVPIQSMGTREMSKAEDTLINPLVSILRVGTKKSNIWNLTLSPIQQKALKFLKQHKVSLLFGDTGSGKTEIYMSYFKEMLDTKKSSIFLMPEISLTPQMDKRLQNHFGDNVVMWHSKLTPLQKKKALQKIYDGSAKIIAGPRSALFLPIRDLGLIVVDEEHDDSYKSSSKPRYNARDLAIYMGGLYGVNVVLGSATPTLSTYIKFPYYRLKGGFYNSKKEFLYEKSTQMLSENIMTYIKDTLDADEQSIVFIPTRANFKYLVCQDCGYSAKCVFCSIGMSIHQKMNALKCHYCNYTQAIPQRCSECHSTSLVSTRLGTAQAVELLKENFLDAKIEQFDRDTITTASKLKKALKRFNDKEVDILVGTQMLSKGHDYHGVTLAVVLGLDNLLNMGDFRAREKALSTLIQVSGRSGRLKDAKVLVQTFNEEFFSTYIDNYDAFLESEKEYRKNLYPPYKKLCRILFSHKNGMKAKEQMEQMHNNLLAFHNIEIVGYGKCGVERIANKYRFEILLRADKSTDIIKAISLSRVDLAQIDMDPLDFS